MSLTTKELCSYMISTYTDTNLAAPALVASTPNDLSKGDESLAKIFPSEDNRKDYMTSIFQGRCALTGDYYPRSPVMPLPATAANSVVITVKNISEPSGADMTLSVVNCSNGKAFTTSELGVYTFDASSVALIVQRKPKNNDATTCRGVSSIGYSVVSLSEYCTTNSGFKDCARLTGDSPSSTAESPSTTSKTPVTPTPSSARKNAVFAVATVCMMVASALSM